tara:strand:+ start:2649 stop:2828 length:180 start_codon:yes stop_codon:yes gene_type:complete
MYVLVENINDLVVKTRNSKLSKVVERGEELTSDYGRLIVCTEEYDQKEGRTNRRFICEV